jgi:hypothetical protein
MRNGRERARRLTTSRVRSRAAEKLPGELKLSSACILLETGGIVTPPQWIKECSSEVGK